MCCSLKSTLSHLSSGTVEWSAEPLNSWRPNSHVPLSEKLCTRLTVSAFFWLTENRPIRERIICEKRMKPVCTFLTGIWLISNSFWETFILPIVGGQNLKKGKTSEANWSNMCSLRLLNTAFINSRTLLVLHFSSY